MKECVRINMAKLIMERKIIHFIFYKFILFHVFYETQAAELTFPKLFADFSNFFHQPLNLIINPLEVNEVEIQLSMEVINVYSETTFLSTTENLDQDEDASSFINVVFHPSAEIELKPSYLYLFPHLPPMVKPRLDQQVIIYTIVNMTNARLTEVYFIKGNVVNIYG